MLRLDCIFVIKWNYSSSSSSFHQEPSSGFFVFYDRMINVGCFAPEKPLLRRSGAFPGFRNSIVVPKDEQSSCGQTASSHPCPRKWDDLLTYSRLHEVALTFRALWVQSLPLWGETIKTTISLHLGASHLHRSSEERSPVKICSNFCSFSRFQPHFHLLQSRVRTIGFFFQVVKGHHLFPMDGFSPHQVFPSLHPLFSVISWLTSRISKLLLSGNNSTIPDVVTGLESHPTRENASASTDTAPFSAWCKITEKLEHRSTAWGCLSRKMAFLHVGKKKIQLFGWAARRISVAVFGICVQKHNYPPSKEKINQPVGAPGAACDHLNLILKFYVSIIFIKLNLTQ